MSTTLVSVKQRRRDGRTIFKIEPTPERLQGHVYVKSPERVLGPQSKYQIYWCTPGGVPTALLNRVNGWEASHINRVELHKAILQTELKRFVRSQIVFYETARIHR